MSPHATPTPEKLQRLQLLRARTHQRLEEQIDRVIGEDAVETETRAEQCRE